MEFHSTLSLVTVCPYCASVVARTDRELADQGKVAEIAASESPLQLGLRGVWRGKAFRLIGRVQYRHSAGGRWDEWYVVFPQERWGWLAEAQGQFALTLHRELQDASAVPAREQLAAGQQLSLAGKGEFTVKEVGQAEVAGAEGELPFSPVADAVHHFVDLEGPDGRFATIEYGPEGPAVYTGHMATLADLGLAEAALRSPPEQTVGALQLNCPQCAGPLSLTAPDEAHRVTCPNCCALLDVQNRKLEYLSTLAPPQPPLRIPLGTRGRLQDVDYTVIGYLRRSVTYDKTYYWQEYLLYSPQHGFRWLIDSDDHWSFGKPVSVGEVTLSGDKVRYGGRDFRIFQSTAATVRQVWGEFFWKVKVGDSDGLKDYIAPPYSLSLETGAGADGISEINATLSVYLPHAEVEAAFRVQNLPRGWGVAPNQPNPVTWETYLNWAATIGLVLAAAWLIGMVRGRAVDPALTVWALGMASVLPLGAAVYAASFESRRWQDSEFNPYSSGDSDDE